MWRARDGLKCAWSKSGIAPKTIMKNVIVIFDVWDTGERGKRNRKFKIYSNKLKLQREEYVCVLGVHHDSSITELCGKFHWQHYSVYIILLSLKLLGIRFITKLKLNERFILEIEMFSVENVLHRLCDNFDTNANRSILKLKTIYSSYVDTVIYRPTQQTLRWEKIPLQMWRVDVFWSMKETFSCIM